MNWIVGFFEAVEHVLNFLFDHLFNHVRAHGRILWRDINDWLDNHGLTWPRFLGLVMVYIVGVFVLALGIAFVGLLVGQSGHIGAAQWIVLFGMLVGIVGVLPFVVLFFVAHGLFKLIFHTGEVAAEVFATKESGGNIPERLRRQLEELKNSSILPLAPGTLLTLYLGVFTAMAMFPMLNIIKYILLGAAFGYIYTWWKNHSKIKGWALSHFLYAMGQAFMFFAVPSWFFTEWLNSHAFIQRWYPTVSGVTPEEVRFFAQLGFAGLVLIIAVIPLYRTTYSEASVKGMNSGDVRPLGYLKRVTSLKKNPDGQVEAEYEPVHPAGLNLGRMRSPVVVAVVAILALIVLSQVLGSGLGSTGLTSLITPPNIFTVVVLGSLAYVAFRMIKKSTQGGGQHG